MSGSKTRAQRRTAARKRRKQQERQAAAPPPPQPPRKPKSTPLAGPVPPWKWERMQRGTRVVDPQLAELAERDPDVAEHLARASETWLNNHYIVTVYRFPEGPRDVQCMSIRSIARDASHDWRDFQRVKNEIAGEDVEGFEIYPAKKRTVDQANQYWVWCLRPGMELPVGFSERSVDGSNDERFPMSRQRPFRRGEKDAI